MSEALNTAVTTFLAEAQRVFTPSWEEADIKRSTEALDRMLREWQAHHRRVESTVIGLLEIVRAACNHEGARRGRNDYEGAWMAACPTCGAVE